MQIWCPKERYFTLPSIFQKLILLLRTIGMIVYFALVPGDGLCKPSICKINFFKAIHYKSGAYDVLTVQLQTCCIFALRLILIITRCIEGCLFSPSTVFVNEQPIVLIIHLFEIQ